MTWTVAAKPTAGTAEFVGGITTGKQISILYTNTSTTAASDSFTVRVSDPKGAADTITVHVTIQPLTLVRYTALGDSIATGTVYPGKTITSYVTYFYQFLQGIYGTGGVVKSDFSADGDRTNELLAKLSLDGSDLVNSVINADVITISIGGNNLMQACKDSSALGGYNFSQIDTSVAEQGRADFELQFPQIIDRVKALNSDAKIILISIYNPYNVSDAALHGTVDSFLFNAQETGVNDVIYGNAAKGYAVADVYTAFDAYAEADNMGAVTYFYPTDLWGLLTRNPHPNALGQSIITQLHEDEYNTLIGK